MKRADASHMSTVVDTLARSFESNPSVNFVVRPGKQSHPRIRGLMKYAFDTCLEYGDVFLSENGHGAALISFPRQRKTSLSTILADARLAISVIGLLRVRKILRRESLINAAHPKEPFCYLWFIGVHPDEQGSGIGSRLLSEIIAECNRLKRPIYLETSVERNVRWYQLFGFEIYQTLQLPYTLYLMRRTSISSDKKD